jgi:hypothetical protein
MFQSIIAHKVEIVTALFLLSEGLALIPSVKANSLFQVIANLIQKAKDAVKPAEAPAAVAAPEAPQA